MLTEGVCHRAMRGVSAASAYVHALLLRVSCAGCASAEVAGGAGAHRWALLGCGTERRRMSTLPMQYQTLSPVLFPSFLGDNLCTKQPREAAAGRGARIR